MFHECWKFLKINNVLQLILNKFYFKGKINEIIQINNKKILSRFYQL